MKFKKGHYCSSAYGKIDALWIEIGGRAYGLAELAGHEYRFQEKHWFIPSEEEEIKLNNTKFLQQMFGENLSELTIKFKE